MLRLSIKINGTLYVPGVAISLIDMTGTQARLGITASREIPVVRGDVLMRGFMQAGACLASEEQFKKLQAQQDELLLKAHYLDN